MIDAHMHLEQKDYDKDRDSLIKEWKKKMKFLVTVCADIKDWEKTKNFVKSYKGFVFAVAAIHPQHIKGLKDKEVKDFFSILKKNNKNIVGIGECGLDYHWVKDEKLREKQRELFINHIKLAKEMKLPLVVHSWESDSDVLDILEKEGMKSKKVLLHQFGGNSFIDRVIVNGWWVSVGPGVLRSKSRKKVVRDMPLDKILLETDSPWFGDGERGTPLNVLKAAEKIAEIKKITVKEVEKQTDKNAIDFFGLSKKR